MLPWISENFYPLALLFLLFAFSLFSIVNMMACIKISFEKSASLVSAFSFSAGVLYGARLLGQVVAGLLKRSSLSQETLVVGCSFFLLYICSIAMFVLSSKKKPAEEDAKRGVEGSAAETGAAAGVEAADAVIPATSSAPESESVSVASAFSVAPDEAPAPAGVDVLHEECLLLAQERGLTPRQTEVLDLLVHGNDVPSIAKKLYISENTVRTHTKKIYLLLDVHSKQEIVDLVDARCVSYSSSPSGGVQQAGVSSDSPSQGETVD